MRRIVVTGAFVGVGILVARAFVPKLHARLLARCEGTFERMPDTFPPKRMMSGIEEIRTQTARILDLLEVDREAYEPSVSHAPEATHDAAWAT